MSRIRLFAKWVLLGVLITFQGSSEAAKKQTFNSTASILEVTSGIEVKVIKDADPKNVVANATLDKTDTTTVTGSKNCSFGNDCSLTIAFKNPDITLALKMKYDSNHISGYWEWTSLTVDGKIGSETIAASTNGDMNITPVLGFTHKSVDVNCQRDYTICAPLKLSWTCDGEEFKAKNSTDSGNRVIIKFPGLQLQPFFDEHNVQKLRFGANWDCDPLISSALWVSLLIGLGLIIAFYWAVDMITSLHTPDKFDDPKGKPIMVPTTD